MKTHMSHCYVICAYKESPYLEECIQSLITQKEKSPVFIATGTPNEYITKLSKSYQIPVFVNPNGSKGIGADWNFALSCAETDLVTLAHQDDLYLPDYGREIKEAIFFCSNPLIAFTDYAERRMMSGRAQDIYENKLLRVKRTMLKPLEKQNNWKSIFWRRRILSMGSAICCPSVTLCRKNLTDKVFHNDMVSNIDWDAWERISRIDGEFAYIPKVLMLHRIHPESTTSGLLRENGRREEDLKVLTKFWPDWIANLIEHFYQNGENSNVK